MRKEVLGLLACPSDNNPLELFEIASTNEEVAEGVLYCPQCRRWFPILEGIPSLMPDKYRTAKQVDTLRKYSEKLPEHVVRHGNPFNISNALSEQLQTNDAEVSEMMLRDKYATERHPGRFGWQPDNSSALTETATFKRLLKLRQGDLVLDVGIGAGSSVSRSIQRNRVAMIGVDFSFESLRICKHRHDLDGENNLSLVQADALHLPFNKSVFDKVISSQVIQHLPGRQDRDAAFHEIHGVLKSNGVFILETLNERYIKRLLLGRIPRLKNSVEPKERPAGLPDRTYLYLYNKGELQKQLRQFFGDVRIDGLFSLYPLSELSTRLARRELKGRLIHRIECVMDRRSPSQLWAQALIATCRNKV